MTESYRRVLGARLPLSRTSVVEEQAYGRKENKNKLKIPRAITLKRKVGDPSLG